MSKAFIFTMDAVLALIPLFIILAAISQLSGGTSLFLQSSILGGERIAQDTLEVMRITGDLESLNQSRLNQTLRSLIPSYYNYSYEVNSTSGILFTIANGTLVGDNIVVARRLALVEIEEILGDPLITIGHSGSPTTEACCTQPSKNIWGTNFYVEDGDLNVYDYWLVGVRNSTGVTASYAITDEAPEPYCCGIDLDEFSGNNIWTGNELVRKIQIDGELDEEETNYVFIRTTASPSVYADYYVIRVPAGTDSSEVTPESAKLKDAVWVTLKLCPK